MWPGWQGEKVVTISRVTSWHDDMVTISGKVDRVRRLRQSVRVMGWKGCGGLAGV